jgi:hypothetical protein
MLECVSIMSFSSNSPSNAIAQLKNQLQSAELRERTLRQRLYIAMDTMTPAMFAQYKNAWKQFKNASSGGEPVATSERQ